MTVPIEISSASAISLYESSSNTRRTNTARWSAERPSRARASSRAGLVVQHARQGAAPGDRRLGVRLGQRLLAGLRRAHVVHGQVGRDAADPGPEGPGQVEAAEGLVRAQEGLLDHVVGHVVAADDAHGRGVDPPLVALHDLLEGKEVPVPCPGQKVGLGGVRRRRAGRSPGLRGTAVRPIGKARPSGPSTIRHGGRPYSGGGRRTGGPDQVRPPGRPTRGR